MPLKIHPTGEREKKNQLPPTFWLSLKAKQKPPVIKENYCLLYGITQFTETASAHYKLNSTRIVREGSQGHSTGTQQNLLHLLSLPWPRLLFPVQR